MQIPHRTAQKLTTIAFVGSYPPRRCGVATFSSDLSEAIALADESLDVRSVALNDRPEGYRYPHRVWFEINRNRLGEYRLAAEFLNMSYVDVVSLQHEFGLFGGDAGAHVLEMIHRLRMPVVATLHTVLREPNADQLEVTRQLAVECGKLVVMADRACDFLVDIYGVPRDKIALIPHGIPDVPFVDPNFYKDQLGVEGKKVILTFGLLSPGKGIENMIHAMPRIIEQHPDAVYIVLGATHPGVLAQAGEEYRLSLQRLAKDLGVSEQVRFVNKFVEQPELVEYLGAADLYVTPYLNETQITSGTLAYAVGTGKAVVSTPYWHAQELLADDRGKLVPFKDPAALADAIVDLFTNETERHAMRKRAYQYTRQMRWEQTAGQYLDLFRQVRDEANRNPKPAVEPGVRRKVDETDPELTDVKLDHLVNLTDDVGILNAARATVPYRRAGYTVDDNAMALFAVLLAHDHTDFAANVEIERLIVRYLAFLEHAFNEDTGRFRAHMNYDRTWTSDNGPEDTHGRAMWALGEAVSRCHRRGSMALATKLFQRALPVCEQLEHPHARAFALIGIHAYLRRFSGDSSARRVREQLAAAVLEQFKAHRADDWPWMMDTLTYANGRFAHALLLSGRWMFNDEMIQVALRSLEWLHQMQTGPSGCFAPIGTDGWYPRGGEKARFDQRPAEVAATIDACLEAFRVTREKSWLERARRCYNWFLGDNDLRIALYDQTTGGCHDALQPHGVSENQSAEATCAHLLSLLSLHDLALDEKQARAAEREKQRLAELHAAQAEKAQEKPAPPTPKRTGKSSSSLSTT